MVRCAETACRDIRSQKLLRVAERTRIQGCRFGRGYQEALSDGANEIPVQLRGSRQRKRPCGTRRGAGGGDVPSAALRKDEG